MEESQESEKDNKSGSLEADANAILKLLYVQQIGTQNIQRWLELVAPKVTYTKMPLLKEVQ
jgi:hypothetical protein